MIEPDELEMIAHEVNDEDVKSVRYVKIRKALAEATARERARCAEIARNWTGMKSVGNHIAEAIETDGGEG